MKKHLAYYISAHGYGHGVRSCDIIRALLTAAPDLSITLVSALPESFLRNRLGGAAAIHIRRAAFDVGMIQTDSIIVDIPATQKAVATLLDNRPHLIQQEIDFLHARHISAVVADIPAIPLEAAARAGVPRLAIGNFSWDWIYSPFALQNAAWQGMADAFRQGYAAADLLLKLPFAPPMTETFPQQMDIPLLARAGTSRREKIAALTGADPQKQWILLSFTTLQWNDRVLRTVETENPGHEFFTVKPLAWNGYRNIHAVDRAAVAFSDVLASVDAVITKPGFGILSECIVNQKPIIYADRSDFIEYPILVDAIQKYLRHVHIPAADLYAGHLAASLQALPHAPPPPSTLAAGGDHIAAREILRYLS